MQIRFFFLIEKSPIFRFFKRYNFFGRLIETDYRISAVQSAKIVLDVGRSFSGGGGSGGGGGRRGSPAPGGRTRYDGAGAAVAVAFPPVNFEMFGQVIGAGETFGADRTAVRFDTRMRTLVTRQFVRSGKTPTATYRWQNKTLFNLK